MLKTYFLSLLLVLTTFSHIASANDYIIRPRFTEDHGGRFFIGCVKVISHIETGAVVEEGPVHLREDECESWAIEQGLPYGNEPVIVSCSSGSYSPYGYCLN